MAEISASRYGEGVLCWADAQLPDVEAGKRFYGELFGWTFGGSDESGGYAESGGRGGSDERDAGPVTYGTSVWASKDGAPVAALSRKTDGRMPTVWTVYFATPDAEALSRRILAGGGQVVTAPLPVGGLGTGALVADPEGAVFGLWQAGSHPGFGRLHEAGTFVWAQLYTRDTETADRFYGGLFHDALFGPSAVPDFGRAPVTDVFPAEMPPHFLVHFRVDDCDAAVEAVRRLGGRVLTPAFRTSYGRVAIVTDNQGASFALLQR
ncbi:VOC family protein [Streptomyces sp. NPDC046805]|uniref:VOC family protein n=1 Tax=Streptomyces sp. NPDC046805 TaxID=3155134 RepID=UPI0033F1F34E